MGSAPCPAPSPHNGPGQRLQDRGYCLGRGPSDGGQKPFPQGPHTYDLLHHLIHGLLLLFQLAPPILQEDQ